MTWRERIVAARARGGFTQEDMKLASHGATCAVGEAAKATGLDYFAISLLTVLLGGRFTNCVLNQDINQAETIFDRIEEVLELKRGQMSEKQGSFSDNSGEHVVP